MPQGAQQHHDNHGTNGATRTDTTTIITTIDAEATAVIIAVIATSTTIVEKETRNHARTTINNQAQEEFANSTKPTFSNV